MSKSERILKGGPGADRAHRRRGAMGCVLLHAIDVDTAQRKSRVATGGSNIDTDARWITLLAEVSSCNPRWISDRLSHMAN